jgi:outer membrane protein OmpA-like peptidoglycan-associated protein
MSVLLLALGGPAAFAQGSPSSQQIINSLRPSGNLVQGGTRGIRLNAPAGGAAAAQPANPSVNLTVNFAFGSADLTPEAMHTLDQLGAALASKDLATFKFRIEGHTDTVGTKEQNLALSERRAGAVVDYVTKKFGVDPSRLQAIGVGETELLVQTPDQTPEPRNRRVQVINLGA